MTKINECFHIIIAYYLTRLRFQEHYWRFDPESISSSVVSLSGRKLTNLVMIDKGNIIIGWHKYYSS